MPNLESNSPDFSFKLDTYKQTINTANLTSINNTQSYSEELEMDSLIDSNSSNQTEPSIGGQQSSGSSGFNPNASSSHSGSSGTASSHSSISNDELSDYQGPFPTINNVDIKTDNYYYTSEDTIVFTDEYNNTYRITNIDGEWILESIVNNDGEYISLLNDKMNLIMNIFKNNNITITGISFSMKNNYIYIFTDKGDFLFDSTYNNLIYSSNGNNNILEENGIYSDLAQIANQYGGYQGILDVFSDKYLDDPIILNIIKKYFPNEDISEEQLQLLFSRIREIGCGYTGCVNTIFDNFSSLSDEEWKNIFGFDRMDNGTYQYNYQYLILDFFLYYQSKYENFNSIDELLGNASELYGQDDLALGEGFDLVQGANGMDSDNLIEVMEEYMNKFNINLNVESVDCSNENFIENTNELFNNGNQIIIITEDINIYYSYDYDGNLLVDDIYDSDMYAHGFTLTGITEDGKWLVSTWGKELMIDPQELSEGQYIEIFSFNYE